MFQQVLLLATLGLLVAYGLGFRSASTRLAEGFDDGGNILAPVTDEPTIDPRDEPWVSSWSPADRAARDGQRCIPTYTEDGPYGTTIQTVSKTCEAGMAHTRIGDRIIIPDSIPLPHREPTIRHELFHIHQRRFPDAWRTFYRRAWSFQFASAPPTGMPAGVVQARRSNPDTWDPAVGGPWIVWQGRYWPVPIYTDSKEPRLREATVVWWDEWRQEVLAFPPAEWSAFFGSPTQQEHPHELAAVYLTAEDRTSEAARRVGDWWDATGQLLWSKSPEKGERL